MKILKIASKNRLVVAQTDSVKLKPWELRISIALSCICGSDLKCIATPKFENQTPGHEFAGVVSELSHEASNLFCIGDRVTAFPMMPCHLCENCIKENFRDCNSKKSIGFDLQGSLAEELVVDSRMVIRIPRDLTMSQGALLEHLCCGYRLADDFVISGFSLNSRIAIIGDGPVALANLRMLVLRGFSDITLFGKYPIRLELGLGLGARLAVNIKDISEFENVETPGFDICVVSAPADLIIERLLPRFSTRCLIFEQTKISDVDLRRLLLSYGCEIFRAFAYHSSDFVEVIQLISNGEIDTSNLITSWFNLEDFAQGYPSLVRKDENIKIAVVSNPTLINF